MTGGVPGAARRVTPRRGSGWRIGPPRRLGIGQHRPSSSPSSDAARPLSGPRTPKPTSRRPPTFASAESAAELDRNQRCARLPAARRARQALSGRCRRTAVSDSGRRGLVADRGPHPRGGRSLSRRPAAPAASTRSWSTSSSIASRPDAPANAYGDQPFSGRAFEAVASLAAWLPSPLAHYGTSVAEPVRRLHLAQRGVLRPRRLGVAAGGRKGLSGPAGPVLRRLARRLARLVLGDGRQRAGSAAPVRRLSRPALPRLHQHRLGPGRRLRSARTRTWCARSPTGIREFDPGALQTAHGAPGKSVADYWQGEPWLQVNNVYTYEPIYARGARAVCAARAQALLPDRERIRERARASPSRGCGCRPTRPSFAARAGQVFGNNPIWHFHGPGLFSAPMTWQEALDSPGARSMTRLRELMATVPWWLLEPDTATRLLIDGRGPGGRRGRSRRAPPTGRSRSSTCPTSREVTVDLGQLAGPTGRGPLVRPGRRPVRRPSAARRSRRPDCGGCKPERASNAFRLRRLGAGSASPRPEDPEDAANSRQLLPDLVGSRRPAPRPPIGKRAVPAARSTRTDGAASLRTFSHRRVGYPDRRRDLPRSGHWRSRPPRP